MIWMTVRIQKVLGHCLSIMSQSIMEVLELGGGICSPGALFVFVSSSGITQNINTNSTHTSIDISRIYQWSCKRYFYLIWVNCNRNLLYLRKGILSVSASVGRRWCGGNWPALLTPCMIPEAYDILIYFQCNDLVEHLYEMVHMVF